MPIQSATGAYGRLLLPLCCHPGSEDPGCLEGDEDDTGYDHGHCDQPSLLSDRDDISEANRGYGHHCEVKGIPEVVDLGIEGAFQEVEYAGTDKEDDDDA